MTGRSAEAGFAGPGVRSDVRVKIEEREDGGLTVDLESKVEAYYGGAIRDQVRDQLEHLGLENARVTIHDMGALPFTIAARVETAALRAGLLGEKPLDLVPEPDSAPSERRRLRRSRLYLPGNDPKYMVNAGLYGSDALILDLEDSVHPAEKDSARLLVANAVRHLDFAGAEIMVRINQLPVGLDDLEAVIPSGPDLILVPKVEDPTEIEEVDRTITTLLERLGWHRPIWIMPIVESALGVESAFDIARSSDRVVALTVGLEDLMADLGVSGSAKEQATQYARERIVNGAAAAGVQPIDSVYADVSDLEGLTSWCERSKALGFEGMGCLHPRQIPVVHHAFAPTPKEIERAQEIVAAFERAQREGLAIVSIGSKMIDAPVVQRAMKVVERARALGLLAEEGSGQ
ncbi:MAG: HpcH/HpaI aldolase/citrate lyase family protein [Gammaproteobacteria bacterium]|nr:HpcH/HpaI aldolase/citrate lyase family protein [Gammaproteobacteria bacterium]